MTAEQLLHLVEEYGAAVAEEQLLDGEPAAPLLARIEREVRRLHGLIEAAVEAGRVAREKGEAPAG
jgi:hypothetical protein